VHDDLWSLVADASEEPVRAGWLSAARTWSTDVTRKVLQPFRSGQAPDPVMVLSDQGLWMQQLQDKVSPPILAVLRRSFRAVTGGEPPSGFDQSQYVTRYLGVSVNRMSHTPDQVYRQITASIAEGVGKGESIPELAARVEGILTVTETGSWGNRATTVARTEVTAANGAGALAAGADLANTSGKQMVKTWVATTRPPSSLRTRPDHLEADGQTVALHAPFDIGGHHMQYPGDPTGPANEVINCRCTLTVRSADEAPTSTVDRQNPRGGA
jgi:hypothetical protein